MYPRREATPLEGHIQWLSSQEAWRSGSVIDCHATTQGLIPNGNGVKTQLHVLLKGRSLNALAVDGT